jgi:hypothetical protein
MKRRLAPFTAMLALAHAAAAAGQAPVTLVIDADRGAHTINRHIYGHFAEHLGRGIYDGFWTKAATGEWHLREDIIEALKKISIPNLRWPGGCFADYYLRQQCRRLRRLRNQRCRGARPCGRCRRSSVYRH